MKLTGYILLLIFPATSALAQDLEQDILNLRQAYAPDKTLDVDIDYVLVQELDGDVDTVEVLHGNQVSTPGYKYSRMGDLEVVMQNGLLLQVDHSTERLVLAKANEQPIAGPPDVQQLLERCDTATVTRYEDVTDFWFYFSTGGYDAIELVLNNKSNLLEEISLGKVKSPTNSEILVMEYGQHHETLRKSYPQIGSFLTDSTDWKVNEKYSNYQLVNVTTLE